MPQASDEWAEFTYRDFYDVPRMIVVRTPAGLVLLDSPFDDAIDEYCADYAVFLLPDDINLAGSWDTLRSRARRRLGSVPVSAVRFDPTRRRALELSSLGQLGRAP